MSSYILVNAGRSSPRGKAQSTSAWMDQSTSQPSAEGVASGDNVNTVLLLMGVAAVVWAVVAFSRLVHLRNQVRTAWADIDVQLRRRHDLVPQPGRGGTLPRRRAVHRGTGQPFRSARAGAGAKACGLCACNREILTDLTRGLVAGCVVRMLTLPWAGSNVGASSCPAIM